MIYIFKTSTVHIDTLELENNIMGGGFNFNVTNSLDCLNMHANNWKARHYFVQLKITVWLMCSDLWLLSRKYTWSRSSPNLVDSILDMFHISHHFLQWTHASCINNGYVLNDAIIEMKWVNRSFERGSSYYKINVEALYEKDFIQDVKNMLLEVQVDCENKSPQKNSGNILKCDYIV